jgi:hypothetical protein
MKWRVYDIQYDTDGNKEIAESLPKELVLELDDDFNPFYELADAISDKTGFLVSSFTFKEFEPDNAE